MTKKQIEREEGLCIMACELFSILWAEEEHFLAYDLSEDYHFYLGML